LISTVILKTAGKFLVPLSLVFALFVYFKGHQTPGGGFVAGLVASVALVVHRMCEGPDSLQRLLPVRERTLIGWGLLFALGTGLTAMVFGLPFLTSGHGALHLSDADPTHGLAAPHIEVASAMAFDLGVFLVVTGVVVGMINALSQELET
jgi:multisubunit Na+/H+ antiporter MnhB subunit